MRLALVVLAACAGAQHPATTTDEIGATRDRWAAAFNGKQLDAVMTTYAMDAVFLPITGNRVVSAAAIKVLYQRIWEHVTPSITLHSHVVERYGDLAYDSGDYEESVAQGGSSLSLAGAYLFVFRREATGWHLVEQIFTERGADHPVE
jgi:ketosteroid isomerase-like protein